MVHHQAELGGGDAEVGVGVGHPQITGHRQLGAGTEGGSLHGGQGGERRVAKGGQHLLERGGEGLVLDTGEVGAGAEVAAGSGEHRQPDIVRGAGQGLVEGVEGLVVEGVSPLGPVEGDHEHVVSPPVEMDRHVRPGR